MKIFLQLLLLCLVTQAHAYEINDVTLDDEILLGNQQVVLNGAGIRKKFLVKVYIGSLYVSHKMHTAEEILADNGAKRMSFHLLWGVSGKQVLEGINEAFLPNNSEAEMKPLEARLNKFAEIFKSIPEIHKGEVVNLDYIPAIGTRILFKEKEVGVIPGQDFHKALLKIWLGPHPVQGSLKKSVLGNQQ